ncbi:MAG: DUF937 domain-containing protein [Planctomycetota bacterium]
MSSLLEMLAGQLGGDNLSMISKEIGADESTTQSAMGAALPLLIGALSRNGSNEQGAQGLMSALEKDSHDGSIFDNMSDFLGNKQYDEPRSGAGILGHLLGGKQSRVEQGVSAASGLGSDATGKLMKMLAPLVLGAIGKKQQSEGLGLGDLMGFLGGEKDAVEKSDSGSMIGGLLDQDGDGDFDLGDVAKLAMGKLFGK